MQAIVNGRLAFHATSAPIREPTRQADLEKAWDDIVRRFLFELKGFGSLIRRKDLPEFREAVEAYEQVLAEWVAKFRDATKANEDALVSDIANAIMSRLRSASDRRAFDGIDLEHEVRKGLESMRIIEPRVRVVIKNVSWESSRDAEFVAALEAALPPEELEGWFEEFTAARQRGFETDGVSR